MYEKIYFVSNICKKVVLAHVNTIELNQNIKYSWKNVGWIFYSMLCKILFNKVLVVVVAM